MVIIAGCVIVRDNKILMVKEAKENFMRNVYVLNDLEII